MDSDHLARQKIQANPPIAACTTLLIDLKKPPR
jgi:hypothetical protein